MPTTPVEQGGIRPAQVPPMPRPGRTVPNPVPGEHRIQGLTDPRELLRRELERTAKPLGGVAWVQYGGAERQMEAEAGWRQDLAALDPRAQPEGPTDPFQGLNRTERFILESMAGVSQTVSSFTRPLTDSEVWRASGAGPLLSIPGRLIMGALNLFDVGAEYLIERPTGLIRQYAQAKRDGTTADFWQNFGRAWRAAHFTYESYGSFPHWNEATQRYTMTNEMLPGDLEMSRIRGYLDRGMSYRDISERMMTDVGQTAFYRGMLADAMGHIILDPINIAMGPGIRVTSRWMAEGIRAVQMLPTAEYVGQATRNLAIAQEWVQNIRETSTAARRIMEIDEIARTAEGAADIALATERATLMAGLGEEAERLTHYTTQARELAGFLAEYEAPTAIQAAAAHFVQAGTIDLEAAEAARTATARLPEIERRLAALQAGLPEEMWQSTQRLEELRVAMDASNDSAEWSRLAAEADAILGTISDIPVRRQVLNLMEQASDLRYAIEAAVPAQRVMRSIQAGAHLYNPFTWFKLRPESMAQELLTRTGDGLMGLLRAAPNEQSLLDIARNAHQYMMDPRLGLSAFTPQGRALLGAVQGARSLVESRVAGFVGEAARRGYLQSMATLLQGPEGEITWASRVLDRISGADGGIPSLIADLERVTAGPLAQSESARAIRELLDAEGGIQPVLEGMRDVFLAGDASIPFDLGALRLHIVNDVNSWVTQQAIAQFGVQAQGPFTRAANAVKAAEALAYLGLNPAYPLRNFLNNELTMWARGVWGMMSEEAIETYWRTTGSPPMRLGTGLGAAEQAAAGSTWERINAIRGAGARAALREATLGGRRGGLGGLVDRFTDALRQNPLRRVDFSAMSSAMEASASRRAWTLGHMQFMRENWQAGRGFTAVREYLDLNYPGAAGELGADFMAQVERGVASSRNPAEILDAAYRPAVFDINDAVAAVARRHGQTPEAVRDILTEPFLHSMQSAIADALSGPVEQVEDKLSALWATMGEGIQSHLDEISAVPIQTITDRAAARLAAGGSPMDLLHLTRDQIDEGIDFMTGHLSNLGPRTEAIRGLPIDQQPAAWERFFAENDAYFGRMFQRMRARTEGIVRAANQFGTPVPGEVMRPFDDYMGAVQTFHTNKAALYRRLRSGDVTLSRIRGLIDQEYTTLIHATRDYGEAMDRFVYRVVGASDRSAMLPDVRAWRFTVNELRQRYMQDTQRMYREVETAVDDAARQAIYNRYNATRLEWNSRINVAEREGFAMMEDWRGFGTHAPADEVTMRIFSSQYSSANTLGNSLDDDIAMAMRSRAVAAAPDRAATIQMVAQERMRLARSSTWRARERLHAEGRWTPEMQRATDRMFDLAPVGPEGMPTAPAIAAEIPAAADTIGRQADRIRWLDALAFESDREIRQAALIRLSEEYTTSPVFTHAVETPLRTGTYGIVSPMTTGADEPERMAAMLAEMERDGYHPIQVAGGYEGVDEGAYLVPGLTDREAMRYGRAYGQQTVLISPVRDGPRRAGGLLHTTGDRVGWIDPLNFDEIQFGVDTTRDYTRIVVDGQPVTFRIPQFGEEQISAGETAFRRVYQATPMLEAGRTPPVEDVLRYLRKLRDQGMPYSAGDAHMAAAMERTSSEMGITLDELYRQLTRPSAAVGTDPLAPRYLLNQTRQWVAPLDGPGGVVTLDRYMQVEGLTTLDPGDARCYTRFEGAEFRRRWQNPDYRRRLYFYIGGTPPEPGVAQFRNVYHVRIEAAQIYDLGADPRGFQRLADLTERENAIRDAGFIGYRNSTSDSPNTIALFEAVNPLEPGAHITTRSVIPGRLYTQRTIDSVTLRSELIEYGGLAERDADGIMAMADARARVWARRTGRSPEEYLTARAFRGIDPGEMVTPAQRMKYSGMISLQEDGSRIIHIFESGQGDPRVISHEFAHLFFDDLSDIERVDVLGIMGHTDLTTAAAEDWADACVRYFVNGQVANPALRPMLDSFRDWIRELWRSIVRWEPRDWDPEMRTFLDSFFGSEINRATLTGEVSAPGAVGNGLPGISYERLMSMVPDEIPAAQAQDELWWTEGRQLMEAFRTEIDAQRAIRPVALQQDLSPYARAALDDYLGHATMQLGDTQFAALRFGEIKRDASLLNYGRRTYFDHFAAHIFPFSFWTTHTAWNWLLWSPDKPYLIADFMRIRGLAQRVQGTMPARFQGSFRVPLASIPGIPSWLGPLYVNPFRVALPFDMWVNPFEQAEERGRSVLERAARILEQQRDAGNITAADYSMAVNSRQGNLWEQAVRQAQADAGEGGDGFDIVQQLIAPHAPLIWAYHVARGTSDMIGPFLPITRTIRSVTAVLGWPGGGLNIEGGFRRLIGLPPGDRWDDYRNERMVTNMISDGTVPVRDGLLALQQHSGPIWDMAVDRAAREYAVMTFSGTIGIPARAYPPGEERSRELMSLMNEAYTAGEHGDTDAITRFWEEHPEAAGRLALFNTPAERLNRFLTDEIWDRWQGLTSLDRRTLSTVLGPDFESSFLDGSTRNPEAIPAETLAVWLRLMGGNPPGTLAVGTLPAQLPPPEISQRAQAFYQEREQFPEDVFALQTAFFRMSSGQERDAFVLEHPVLRDYWNWRRDWLLQNPDVAPYLVEDPSDLPRLQTAAEASAAAAGQPITRAGPQRTWEQWGQAMQQDTWRLMGDRFRTSRAISGDLLDEIEQVAEQMGITPEALIADMRQAWKQLQGP